METTRQSDPRGTCDRCGGPVQAHEDATFLDEVTISLRERRHAFCGFLVARHIRCSPSRYQYFSGDRQPERPYRAKGWTEADEAEARKALAILEAAATDYDRERETYNDAIKRHIEAAWRTPGPAEGPQ